MKTARDFVTPLSLEIARASFGGYTLDVLAVTVAALKEGGQTMARNGRNAAQMHAARVRYASALAYLQERRAA